MKRIAKKIVLALIPGSFVLGLYGCELNQAPDSGTWRGTAVFRDDLYEPKTCQIQVDVMHADEKLNFSILADDCRRSRSGGDAFRFDLRGDQLLWGGRLVGRASANGSVSLDLPDLYLDGYSQPARRLVATWSRVGDSLEFNQELYFEGRAQSIHAWLKRESAMAWDGTAEIHD